MSLYFDGVAVLTTPPSIGGSFKSRIYSSSNSLKASPAQVFALVTEAAKWDIVLKEVIEKADLLSLEPKVCLSYSSSSSVIYIYFIFPHRSRRGNESSSTLSPIRPSHPSIH
jgi:hypothetical protein